VAAETEPTHPLKVVLEPPTLVAAVVAVKIGLAAMAVQALSFFATPAQFNISLVE
jgi:hypothetical protein